MARVAFLGPSGTFSEEALLADPDLAQVGHVPCPTMLEVIEAVEGGAAELGIVPIENAIEGAITQAVDALAFETDLLVRRELVLPVSLNLAAHPGTRVEDVRTVASIPYAIAQCRRWLREALPDARIEAADSTASAAGRVARSRTPGLAAICNRLAAELHGLEVIAAEIEDHPENATRFFLLGRGIPEPTGHDKTSIVCFQREDRPGSLLGILQEFAARAINITRLESRPAKTWLGDYCFVIDFEGHVADELVADCLRTLHAKQGRVKFLGSYPAAETKDGRARRRAAAKAWREAEAWVDGLRSLVGPDGAVMAPSARSPRTRRT